MSQSKKSKSQGKGQKSKKNQQSSLTDYVHPSESAQIKKKKVKVPTEDQEAIDLFNSINVKPNKEKVDQSQKHVDQHGFHMKQGWQDKVSYDKVAKGDVVAIKQVVNQMDDQGSEEEGQDSDQDSHGNLKGFVDNGDDEQSEEEQEDSKKNLMPEKTKPIQKEEKQVSVKSDRKKQGETMRKKTVSQKDKDFIIDKIKGQNFIFTFITQEGKKEHYQKAMKTKTLLTTTTKPMFKLIYTLWGLQLPSPNCIKALESATSVIEQWYKDEMVPQKPSVPAQSAPQPAPQPVKELTQYEKTLQSMQTLASKNPQLQGIIKLLKLQIPKTEQAPKKKQTSGQNTFLYCIGCLESLATWNQSTKVLSKKTVSRKGQEYQVKSVTLCGVCSSQAKAYWQKKEKMIQMLQQKKKITSQQAQVLRNQIEEMEPRQPCFERATVEFNASTKLFLFTIPLARGTTSPNTSYYSRYLGSEGSVTALRTFDVFFYSSWYGPVVNWYNFGKEKEFNSENVKRDLEEQRRANQHRHLYDYLVSWVLWFGLLNNWGKPKQENRPSWSQVTANNSSAVSRSTVVKPLQNFEWL